MNVYTVLVEYVDPRASLYTYAAPDAITARAVYAKEASRIAAGGIVKVLLCRDGVVVAQAHS